MKTIRVSTLLAILLTATLSVSMVPALAQEKAADTMELVREKIRTDKKLFIAANMQLTEAEAKGFWPVYEDYQKELGNLAERTMRVIEDYAKNYQIMTEEAAKKLLDDYLAIEGDHVKIMRSYLPTFRKVLPEKKAARYYQLENKIKAVIDFELAAKIPLVR